MAVLLYNYLVWRGGNPVHINIDKTQDLWAFDKTAGKARRQLASGMTISRDPWPPWGRQDSTSHFWVSLHVLAPLAPAPYWLVPYGHCIFWFHVHFGFPPPTNRALCSIMSSKSNQGMLHKSSLLYLPCGAQGDRTLWMFQPKSLYQPSRLQTQGHVRRCNSALTREGRVEV